MLVWRALKRYEETGGLQNQPEQGRPQTVRSLKLVKTTKDKIRRNPKEVNLKIDKIVQSVVWDYVYGAS